MTPTAVRLPDHEAILGLLQVPEIQDDHPRTMLSTHYPKARPSSYGHSISDEGAARPFIQANAQKRGGAMQTDTAMCHADGG